MQVSTKFQDRAKIQLVCGIEVVVLSQSILNIKWSSLTSMVCKYRVNGRYGIVWTNHAMLLNPNH